jgi:ribosomal protein S18 acetylase RimI-like enzyme
VYGLPPLGTGPAGTPITSPLAWVELGVGRLRGQLLDYGDVWQVRTPDNWVFHHGNYLFLPAPPRHGSELVYWTERFRELFGGDPVGHVCLCWDRGRLEDSVRQAAITQGFVPDDTVVMHLVDLPTSSQHGVPPSELVVRPIDVETEWAQLERLNRDSDPLELVNLHAPYQQFKESWRASWRKLIREGHATWFGAFLEGELIGQCGLVTVDGLGGFESVETHPDHRRKGVCGALMARVMHERAPRHPRGYVLGAEPNGPAIGLYRRMGFVDIDRRESIVIQPPEG